MVNLSSIAKKFVSDNTKSIGGRRGLTTDSLQDPFSPGIGAGDDGRNAEVTSILQYPSDLGGVPDQGHFILFFINEQQPGELEHNDKPPKTSVSENAENNTTVNQVTGEIRNTGSGAQYAFASGGRPPKKVDDIKKAQKTENKNAGNGIFTLKRAPTKRLSTAIALYMPTTVDVTYNAGYEEKEIGRLAGAGVAAFDAFKGGGINAAVDAVAKKLPEMVDESIFDAVDAIAPGAKAIMFAKSGKVVSNRMELIFSGVGKRSFSYTFKFLPKSQKESKDVKSIVDKFKFHMLPKVEGDPGSSRTFVTPDTFDIEYRWIGSSNHNPYLNKISTCVLENMSVKYGGSVGYQAFEPDENSNTPPVETEISLQFKELEIITKARAEQGY